MYPGDSAALARGAGVEQETTKPSEAYGAFAGWARVPYREGSLPDLVLPEPT